MKINMAEKNTKINITSSIAEKGLDAAKVFLSKLIKPAVEETGLLLADHIHYFRWKNQINLLQKAEAYIKEKNISVKEIPVKTIAPLLAGASLEEDEDLKQMWVGLLVNYVNTESSFTNTVFPYLLTQLSTKEAKFLELLFRNYQAHPKAIQEMHMKFLKPEDRISDAEFGNLRRLGLIENSLNQALGNVPGIGRIFNVRNDFFKISSLGLEFMKACELERI